ncbi:type II secretion system protein GspD [Rubritalea profundi]|uniref:type II secretion system protein GspD n=1 Tax=Rubritalea profundi TaxID=1658618 RepID=UPI00197FB084|nr:hypothetical protein [Rubritalea profundi]
MDYISVNDMSVAAVCRMLTHVTEYNVTATANAQKVECSFLFMKGGLEQALNTMCVSSGLVYRKDPIYEGFQILTLEEFRENTVFSASESLEVFKVEPANLELIAKTIESLFPGEAIFSDPEGVLDFSSTSGSGQGQDSDNNNNNDNNDNNRTVTGSSSSQNSSGVAGESDGTQLSMLETQTIEQTEQQLGTSIYITVSLEHSQLIIRTANVSALSKIKDLISQMNLPLRQVLLEMKILELNVGDGENVGVDWNVVQGDEMFSPADRDGQGVPQSYEYSGVEHGFGLGNFATEAASTFAYTYLSRDIQARVQALATNNDVEVVATPMLMAVSNREATFVAAEERVITTGASQNTTISGDNGTVNDQIITETEVRDIGTTLKIIPRVNNDGTVALFVNQENSTVKIGNNSIPIGGSLIPVDSVEKSNIEVSVVARNGKTIAIGGLIRTENSYSVDKVPVIGDIPLLGRLFRRDKTTSRKTELIILITPHIINGGDTRPTDEILSDSKHRYTTGGIEVIDKQNKGLDFYQNRTDDSLFPRLPNKNKSGEKISSETLKTNNSRHSKKDKPPVENRPFRIRR